MHNDMNCCHLDLCMENIVISKNPFIKNKNDNTIRIDPNIYLKIVDFGLSEIFSPYNRINTNPFKCDKWGLKDSYQCTSPRVYNEFYYNAKKADIWSLGIILYKMLTNKFLYKLPNSREDEYFYYIEKNIIDMHLKINHLKKYINNKKILKLLNNMLNINENKRYSSIQILKCEWFESYYKKYSNVIELKSKLQNELNKKQLKSKKMQSFPYYSIN